MTATAFSLPTVLPEFILAIGVLALLLLGAWRGERSVWLVTETAVALIGVALIVLFVHRGGTNVTFYGAFTDDAFSRFMKALSLIGSLITLLLSIEFMAREKKRTSTEVDTTMPLMQVADHRAKGPETVKIFASN